VANLIKVDMRKVGHLVGHTTTTSNNRWAVDLERLVDLGVQLA
jgi:hypothetical protein